MLNHHVFAISSKSKYFHTRKLKLYPWKRTLMNQTVGSLVPRPGVFFNPIFVVTSSGDPSNMAQEIWRNELPSGKQ